MENFDWQSVPIQNIIAKTDSPQFIKRGSKIFCRCPLHHEKTASFIIYPNNCFYCWGCATGGNSLTFINKRLGLIGYKAIEWMKENFSNYEPEDLPDLSIKTPIKKHMEQIENKTIVYFHSLMDNLQKRDYWHNRGFTDKTINEQLLGFNGSGFTIPIWTDKPKESICAGYKIRNISEDKPKYVKVAGGNCQIYGKYYFEFAPCILFFAGELDCLRAIQDNLPSASLIDGMNSWKNLPDNWPNKIFPHVEKIITVFDVGEEIVASKLAEQWEIHKGKFTAKVFHWPEFDGKDYCDYRQKHNDFDKLIERYL